MHEEAIQPPGLFSWLGAEVDAPVNHISKTDGSSVTTLSPSRVLTPSRKSLEPHTPTSHWSCSNYNGMMMKDQTAPHQHGRVFDEKAERQHFKLQVGKSAKTPVFSHFHLYILQLQSPFATHFNWLLAIMRCWLNTEVGPRAPAQGGARLHSFSVTEVLPALDFHKQSFAPPPEISILEPSLWCYLNTVRSDSLRILILRRSPWHLPTVSNNDQP